MRANFGDISAHGNGDATQKLDPFRNRIDHLNLLIEVLIKQEMKLIERWAGYLPVVLLIHIPQARSSQQEAG